MAGASAGSTAQAAVAPRVVTLDCGDAGSMDVVLPSDAPARAATALPIGTRLVVGYRLRDRRTGAIVAGGPGTRSAAPCTDVPVSGVHFAAVAVTPPPGVAAGDLLDGVLTFALVSDDPVPGPLTGAAVPGAGQPFPFADAIARYLSGRTGRASVAVFDTVSGRTYSYAPERSFVTASIVKATILATLLRQAQDANRALTSGERSLATRMIEVSDNAAATSLWNEVGGGPGVARFMAKVGMPSTTPGSDGLWGLTTTNTPDQVALMRVIAYPTDVLDAGRRAYEHDLMVRVVSSQHWGVSAGPPAGSTVALKNGWLPHGVGWVINSIGHVRSGSHDYVIAVLSSGSPSMSYGISTVEGLSRIVWSRLPQQAAASLDGVLVRGGASGRVEVHALAPDHGYTTFLLHRASAFAAADPRQWTFLVAPGSGSTGDGISAGDLVGIRMQGGASGRVEVHVASAASGYRAFSRHVATAMHAVDPAQWQFTLTGVAGSGSGADLVGVHTTATGSGRVEVHVLSEATGYRGYSVHAATPLPAGASVGGQWRFLADDGGDLVGVHHVATSSRRTEVHVLSSRSRYTVWSLHRATPLGFTDPAWSFALGDQNADGATDLIAVRTSGGASRRVEAHVLSGATGFGTWTLHAATALAATTAPWQWSAN